MTYSTPYFFRVKSRYLCISISICMGASRTTVSNSRTYFSSEENLHRIAIAWIRSISADPQYLDGVDSRDNMGILFIKKYTMIGNTD
jgi:hypothetical protein